MNHALSRRHPPARLAALLLPALLAACGAPEGEPDVKVTAQVQVQPVVLRSFDDAVDAYGVVEAAAGDARAVVTQVEAQVAELYVQPGQHVHRGEPLVRLVPSALTALEVGRAQRDALAADVEVQRVARLREQGLATQSELQAATAAAESARALRESLAARAGQGGSLTLSAPADGIVEALAARPGEVLTAGTVLARVEPPASRLVRVGLEADAVAGLRAGLAVQLSKLTGEEPIAGHVVDLDPRPDPASGLATALVRADAPLQASVGTRLRARIIRATHRDVAGVARSAVLYEADTAHVFVVVAGKAQAREVRLGLQDGTQLEILAGVQAGEQVITVGNDEVADAMPVRIAAPAAETPGP